MLITGPSDGAYVPATLEAKAAQFLAPAPVVPGQSDPGQSGGGGLGLAGFVLDRDMLSPDSGTVFQITRSQTLGLRRETNWTLSPRRGDGFRESGETTAFAAFNVGVGRQDFHLPQGMGPLTDATDVKFRTRHAGAEFGLRHERGLWQTPDLRMNVSLAFGAEKMRSQSHFRSALIDIHTVHRETRRHATVGVGLKLRPLAGGLAVEWRNEGRVFNGGQKLLRSEIRLQR